MLCDKAHEMLADTSARFGHFREVLVATEGRADANGLVAEIALLRAIRARCSVDLKPGSVGPEL